MIADSASLPGFVPRANANIPLIIQPGVDAAAASAASSTPFYKDPINLAVAAGGVLAIIGGWMLFGKKRK